MLKARDASSPSQNSMGRSGALQSPQRAAATTASPVSPLSDDTTNAADTSKQPAQASSKPVEEKLDTDTSSQIKAKKLRNLRGNEIKFPMTAN